MSISDGRPPHDQLKVLVVEDHLEALRSAESAIARAGFATVAVDTAAAAIHAVEARSPDIVVVDMRLGESSGLDVLQALTLKSNHRPLTIAWTGDPEPFRRRAEQSGLAVDLWVEKGPTTSISIEQLVSFMSRFKESVSIRQSGRNSQQLDVLLDAILTQAEIGALYAYIAECAANEIWPQNARYEGSERDRDGTRVHLSGITIYDLMASLRLAVQPFRTTQAVNWSKLFKMLPMDDAVRAADAMLSQPLFRSYLARQLGDVGNYATTAISELRSGDLRLEVPYDDEALLRLGTIPVGSSVNVNVIHAYNGVFHIGDSTSYSVGEGFAGPDMGIHGNTINFPDQSEQTGGNVDFDAVSTELIRARERMEHASPNKTDETYESISTLTIAKRAATDRDGPLLLATLKNLSPEAVRAIGDAGAMTLTRLIKSASGMPGTNPTS